jgi:HSP20 family protein
MTTLVNRTPFRELDLLERRIRPLLYSAGFIPTPLPAADVYETDEEFVVEVEAPGFEKKQLAVEVWDHTLTIKGERTEAKDKEEKSFQFHERLEREFERRFFLPATADTERVTAHFEHGVIEVHAPKVMTHPTRKVAIES